MERTIRKIIKNKGNNQLLLTLPPRKGFKEGEYVEVIKIPTELKERVEMEWLNKKKSIPKTKEEGKKEENLILVVEEEQEEPNNPTNNFDEPQENQNDILPK